MYGIKAVKSGSIRNAKAADKTVDTTLRNPMIELTVNPKRFATFDYLFTGEPADGSTTSILEIPHGYDYKPAATLYASTDYDGRSLKTFFMLEFFVSDTVFDIPPRSDEMRIYYYTDVKNLYIKAKRTGSGILPAFLNSTWRFTYRIYALTG